MEKLTESGYRLPLVEALSAFDLFDKGTTAPMGIWGVDTITGVRAQYVVKFKNSDRMTTTSSAFELIGSWMALEIGLPVVEPSLINISPEFVNTLNRGQEGYRTAIQSQGINYGSKYQPGYSNIPEVSFSLPDNLMATAKLIYVFDVFIANTDRGHQRPNVVSNGSELLIYDHELAFSFLRLLPLFRNKTPWILNETDRVLYEKHFFYKMLRELKTDLTPQVTLLQCFDDGFWKKVFATLPHEWVNNEIKEIAPYLTSILENIAYFAESLNKTLST